MISAGARNQPPHRLPLPARPISILGARRLSRGIWILSISASFALVNCFSIVQSQTIDEYILEQLTLRHIPGLSACIVKHGTLPWVGNYGLANVSQGTP